MNNHSRSLWRVGLIVAWLTTIATGAYPKDDPAIDAFLRGREAFNRQDFVAARTEFNDSFNQFQHPLTAYFLSMSYLKLADFQNAKKWANTALTPIAGYPLDARYIAASRDIVSYADRKLSPPPAPTPSANGISVSTSAITQPPSFPVPGEVPVRRGGPSSKMGGTLVTRFRAAGTIQVETATYGGNCGAARGNATAHTSAGCNGKSSCAYVVDYTVIGDPVPGCVKDYDVRYTCVGSQTKKSMQITGEEAGFGKTLTLSCP